MTYLRELRKMIVHSLLEEAGGPRIMSSNSTTTSRLAIGAAGLVTVISATILIIGVVPPLAEMTNSKLGATLYKDLIRRPIFKLVFGSDIDLPWSNTVFDVALLWLSLFAVINFFVFRHEGVFLWGHIRKNYCSSRSTSSFAEVLCTTIKWLIAFAATPIACLHIAAASIKSKYSLFTSFYITIDPSELSSHLKKIGLGIGILIALWALVPQVK